MASREFEAMNAGTPVPLWMKLSVAAFTAVLVPVYWLRHGPTNFLWISDIAWFATVIILWRNSRLLNSMMLIGAMLFELYWNLAFLVQLSTGLRLGGVTDYMFDPALPLWLRSLSLFHVPLPFIWTWLFFKWGYDRRALWVQTAFLVPIVLLTYLITDPDKNINWVHSPHVMGWDWMSGAAWVVLYLILVPTVVYWPLSRLFERVDRSRGRSSGRHRDAKTP